MYVLPSQKTQAYYVGYSDDIARRLAEHNRGKVRSTRLRVPYDVVYVEESAREPEARHRARDIKRHKSRKYIDGLIRNALVAQLD